MPLTAAQCPPGASGSQVKTSGRSSGLGTSLAFQATRGQGSHYRVTTWPRAGYGGQTATVTGSRASRTRFVLVSAIASAIASALIFLLQRFVFHDDWGWPGVLIMFAAIFLAYLAGPWVRRFFRGPEPQ